MGSKEAQYEAAKLGAHQTIAIDGTTRYSTELAPGLYELYAEGEGCYLCPLAAASGVVDSANTYLPAGGIRYYSVDPTPETAQKDFIGVVRSGSGTGTLHINRVDADEP